jgi:hypothetical protein
MVPYKFYNLLILIKKKEKKEATLNLPYMNNNVQFKKSAHMPKFPDKKTVSITTKKKISNFNKTFSISTRY